MLSYKNIIFLISFSFIALTANAKTLTGKVVKIVDGDTVHILVEGNQIEKIRLAGIDTPEIRPSQAFGKAAKRKLIELLDERYKVTIEWGDRDRYKRIVGKVIQKDVDINLQLVKAGYAWHYKKYQDEQSKEDRKLYSQAELKARELKLGLFSDPHSIPPWEFRKLAREQRAKK